MESKSILKTGGVCAALVGISYLVGGIAYLLLPAEQKGGTLLHDTDKFLVSLANGSTFITIHHLVFAVGALFGIGVVMAVFDLTRPLNSGWTQWLNMLAGLGFGVTAIDHFRILTVEPARAAVYAAGDAVTRSAVAATPCFVSIDPVMWLGFGLPGIWVFVISYLALRKLALPRAFGIIGMIAGVFYFFVEVATLLNSQFLMIITAGLGAIVLGPVWYIWLGRILRKRALADKT